MQPIQTGILLSALLRIPRVARLCTIILLSVYKRINTRLDNYIIFFIQFLLILFGIVILILTFVMSVMVNEPHTQGRQYCLTLIRYKHYTISSSSLASLGYCVGFS
jgi:uncharacterized Tic20 family protein